MPKPTRSTSNPFGQKFLSVMREKGIEGDFVKIAEVFKVKVPSVYDWVNHGRFAKARFAQLASWSGHSLDWWFDIPTPPVGANEPPPSATYAAPPPQLNTAQRDVLQAFDRLPPSRQKAVREELMREAAQFMSDVLEFQRREGVTGAVDPARAAAALPVRPDGEQPETAPGQLE